MTAYEAGPGWITVEFGEAMYLYTDASAGAEAVLAMQRLAEAGRGLGGYIARHVGDGYAKRLR